MDPVFAVPVLILVLAVVFFLGWFLNSKVGKNSLLGANEKVKAILADAEKEAKNLKREKILEVKDEWYKKKQEFDSEVNTNKQKLQNFQRKLESREENLDRKYDLVLSKEKDNKHLSYIIPNKILSTKYGTALRELVNTNYSIYVT